MNGDVPQRSLLPHEHGAYAQLAAPLAAALIAWRPTLAGALIAVAACCAFLANEPLRVVLGHRGAKRRERELPRATRWLAIEGGAAAACGALGLVLAQRDTLAIAAAVALPAAMSVALAWKKQVHSLLGEAIVACALAGAAAPVAVADGAPIEAALLAWAAWAAGYGCTVIAVHRVIARNKAAASAHDVVAAIAVATVAIAGIVGIATRVPLAAVATPLAAMSAVLVVRPPPARRLRAIGVALVVASVASGAIAIYTVT